MVNNKKIFLDRDNWNTNDIYYYLREVNDYILFRKLDTITKDVDIVSINKDEAEKRFYSVEDFLNNSVYIGDSGYYEEMLPFERAIFQDYILLYKDPYHELLYDTILDDYYMAGSIYRVESFMITSERQTLPKQKKKIIFTE